MSLITEIELSIEPYEFTEKKMRAVGDTLTSAVQSIANRTLFKEMSVNVELWEGSLKGTVSLLGLLFVGTYGHVADYKGFKDSVAEMCVDVRRFGVDVCEAFERTARTGSPQRVRFAPASTPDMMKDIIWELTELEVSGDSLSLNEIKQQIGGIKKQLQVVARKLDKKDQIVLVNYANSRTLPIPTRFPLQLPPVENKYAIHSEPRDEPINEEKNRTKKLLHRVLAPPRFSRRQAIPNLQNPNYSYRGKKRDV